jgi:hypothetical protein
MIGHTGHKAAAAASNADGLTTIHFNDILFTKDLFVKSRKWVNAVYIFIQFQLSKILDTVAETNS